jgi:transcription initiation factor IIE alpha subunit
MLRNTWKVQPIHITVIEILEEKGSLTDEDLFDTLKAFYKEIGFDELNRPLMKMEVTRLISVSSVSKDKRLVHLNKRRTGYAQRNY